MAGPLAGIATQQQTPVQQNNFQQGINTQQNRANEETEREQRTARTTALESNETSNADNREDTQNLALRGSEDDSVQFSGNEERGSVIDITV